MDQIVKILQDLGLNQTFFYQLGIFVITLIIGRFLFVNKLRFVLEHREEKTVKEEQNADRMLEKTAELEEKYRKRMDEAFEMAQHVASERRKRVMKEEMDRHRGVEEGMDHFAEKTRKEIQIEVDAKRQELFQEADTLAHDLVNKVAN